MADFLLLMHNDYDLGDQIENWQPYLDMLSSAGALRGGSVIGSGLCVRRSASARDISSHLVSPDHASDLSKTRLAVAQGAEIA